MTGILDAKELFKKAQLPFPPIPRDMVSDVHCLYEWMYGTRSVTISPYAIDHFVDESKSEQLTDYLIFGHAGHGINSYAIHYYLVRGPLAIFIQWGWGGVYMDNKKQAKELKIIFAMTKDLIRVSEQKYFKKIVTPSNRLVVIESDFHGSFWWLSTDMRNWTNRDPVGYGIIALKEALKWIDESKSQLSKSS